MAAYVRVAVGVIVIALLALGLSWWVNDVSPNDCSRVLRAKVGTTDFHLSYAMDAPFDIVLKRGSEDICSVGSHFDLLTYNHVADLRGTLADDRIVVEGEGEYFIGEGYGLKWHLAAGTVIGEGCGDSFLVNQREVKERELELGVTVGQSSPSDSVLVYARWAEGSRSDE